MSGLRVKGQCGVGGRIRCFLFLWGSFLSYSSIFRERGAFGVRIMCLVWFGVGTVLILSRLR